MEGRPLDQVAVREAREYVAHWLTLPTMTPEERDAIRIILAALDEGREASAPFARFFKGPEHDLSPAKDTTPLVTFQGQDGHALADLWMGDLRRLAAWSETVSDPEGKNDG